MLILYEGTHLVKEEQYPTFLHPSKPCLDYIGSEMLSMTCSLDLINPSLCLSVVTSSHHINHCQFTCPSLLQEWEFSLEAQTHIWGILGSPGPAQEFHSSTTQELFAELKESTHPKGTSGTWEEQWFICRRDASWRRNMRKRKPCSGVQREEEDRPCPCSLREAEVISRTELSLLPVPKNVQRMFRCPHSL